MLQNAQRHAQRRAQRAHAAAPVPLVLPAVAHGFSAPQPKVEGFRVCRELAPQASPVRAHVCRAMVAERPASLSNGSGDKEILPGLQVVIAGAGISGLTLALGLLKKGIKVQVLERDLTAIRGEGKIRGPIQVQSNALAALEAIDPEVAQAIMNQGCITGDRINGLCDGVSGDWYVKFDTFHPAVERGLPVTRVIGRVNLQEVLAEAVTRYGGEDVIQGGCHVVAYEEFKDAAGKKRVAAILEDGRRVEGDVLVGTDGIWSKIRKQLLGDAPAHYSEYTCYTGISDYVPADIDLVGYRVFLGNGQYFVSSDVGGGKMQWYAFHKEPAGGQDTHGQRKSRLLQLFGHWNYNVVDLIKATPEEDVLRRDIYDRAPVFNWSKGRVALMGDSAHAMQPNLGQGGCMAIEDAFQLVNDLVSCVSDAAKARRDPDIEGCLRNYQAQRVVRVSAIHGMAGMAAFMASTYKAYLGEGMGPLEFITDYHIPHPGRVVGQGILKLTMPLVLGWVLGGNTNTIETARAPACKVADKPKHFDESEFDLFMHNDDALAERAGADWLLVAERALAPICAGASTLMPGLAAPARAAVMAMSVNSASSSSGGGGTAVMTLEAPASVSVAAEATAHHTAHHAAPAKPRYGLPPFEYKGAYMNLAPARGANARPTLRIGASRDCDVVVDSPGAAAVHATVEQLAQGRFQLRDASGERGTWVNGMRVPAGGCVHLHAGDVLEFGSHPAKEVFRVKLSHRSYRTEEVRGDAYTRVDCGSMMSVA